MGTARPAAGMPPIVNDRVRPARSGMAPGERARRHRHTRADVVVPMTDCDMRRAEPLRPDEPGGAARTIWIARADADADADRRCEGVGHVRADVGVAPMSFVEIDPGERA